jgi:Ca-activated chloride channel homolog
MKLRLQSGPAAAVLVLALLLPGVARAQERTIRAEVNLVNVLASVVDSNGRPVPDLSAENFELIEEGRAQRIEIFEPETNLPLDLALMIDVSLSTQKELRFQQEAAARFIRQILRPGDRLAVFQFADTVDQLSRFSDDVREHQQALRRIVPGAGTVMYDAIYLASELLERSPPGRRRVIVLVTDAGESTSTVRFEQARRAALSSQIMLYTILIRPIRSESGRNTAGEHALITISDVTGGAMYFPEVIEQLDEMYERIDRELRMQYRLGYYPEPRPPAGAYRRLELRVRAPEEPHTADGAVPREKARAGYEVRYRRGYYASEEVSR